MITDELKAQIQASTGRKVFYDYLKSEFDNADGLLDKFDRLTELYFEVNSVINISAMRTVDDIYVKHYLDSVYPYKYFDGTVCDVGCGGGFPCLPLALVTDHTVTGVDSVGKKLLLIQRSVSELNIKNLKCDYARSEELAKLRREYDTVCARALADVEKSIAFCAPLAKSGGRIVLYKTQNDSQAKQQSLNKHGLTPVEVIDYILPSTDIKRRLFVYKKK